MTGGFKEQTTEWVRRRGVKYPYADDSSYSLAGPFDIYGLPHAILVAPTGEVIFSGPSDEITEDMIKTRLAGALKKPLCELPDSVATVRDALVKGDFTAAEAALQKLAPEVEARADAATALQELFALRLKGVEAAVKADDLFGANEALAALLPHVAAKPEAKARLEAAAAAIKAAPNGEKRLAAQRRLRELATPPSTDDQGKAALEEARQMAKDYAGTSLAAPAERAARFLKRILAM